MRFYRNLAYPTPFDEGRTSLDFSLQLAMGIRNFPGIQPVAAAAATAEAAVSAPMNMREGSPEASAEAEAVGAGPDDPADAEEGYGGVESQTDSGGLGSLTWLLVGLGIVAVLAMLAMRRK